jgi:tetratricopeptide (TPR) repeat protein
MIGLFGFGKTAAQWDTEGSDLKRSQRYKESIKCFDKAIEIDPNYFHAYQGKANALCYLKRYEEAIKSCDKALGINPEDTWTWLEKAAALDRLQRYEEALEILEMVFQIKPTVNTWKFRESVLKKLGEKGLETDHIRQKGETGRRNTIKESDANNVQRAAEIKQNKKYCSLHRIPYSGNSCPLCLQAMAAASAQQQIQQQYMQQANQQFSPHGHHR